MAVFILFILLAFSSSADGDLDCLTGVRKCFSDIEPMTIWQTLVPVADELNKPDFCRKLDDASMCAAMEHLFRCPWDAGRFEATLLSNIIEGTLCFDDTSPNIRDFLRLSDCSFDPRSEKQRPTQPFYQCSYAVGGGGPPSPETDPCQEALRQKNCVINEARNCNPAFAAYFDSLFNVYDSHDACIHTNKVLEKLFPWEPRPVLLSGLQPLP